MSHKHFITASISAKSSSRHFVLSRSCRFQAVTPGLRSNHNVPTCLWLFNLCSSSLTSTAPFRTTHSSNIPRAICSTHQSKMILINGWPRWQIALRIHHEQLLCRTNKMHSASWASYIPEDYLFPLLLARIVGFSTIASVSDRWGKFVEMWSFYKLAQQPQFTLIFRHALRKLSTIHATFRNCRNFCNRNPIRGWIKT